MAASSLTHWQWLSQQQIIKYCRVAPMSIWVFDYFLTLDEEVCLLTNGKWGITHVLYIPARFFPLLSSFCGTYNALVTTLSLEKCVALYRAAGGFLYFDMLAAEGLLLIRVIALWNHDRRVRRALIIVYCIVAIVMLVCVSIMDSYKFNAVCEQTSSSHATPFDTALSRVTLGMFSSAAFFELVVLALTILQAHRWRHSGFRIRSSILSAVLQGNLVYTLAIFLTSIVNIAFFALPLDDGWNGILINFQAVLHGVVASRILFNLRDTVNNRTDDVTIPMTRLRFAATPSTSQDTEFS